MRIDLARTTSSVRRLAAASIAAALIHAGSLAAAATAARAARTQPSRQYTIEQFMATKALTGASFSAKEDRILFSSNESGIYNAYSVPVTGGTPSPVTRSSTDSTYAVSYFPKDDRVLYTHDKGGDENDHLYVMDTSGSERDLTPGEKLKATFAGWTRDGGAFYVLVNDRDPKFFDLDRYDAATYERTLVYKDETGYQLGGVSDDQKWIAFSKAETTADSDIYLWDVASKEMKLISKHDGQATYQPAAFDTDSKKLYYLTNDGAEFMRVRSYDLASGRQEDVEKADWDIGFTDFSHDGKYRVSAINDDGRTVIKLYLAKTGEPVPLPKLPEGEITSIRIARSEERMAFYVNGDRSPNNLYVYDFDAKTASRLTDALGKEIDPEDLADSDVVRFKSFDGLAIPNILYKPLQASPERRAPALVWVHGGPGGQTRKGYSALIQYLVNH
jgi:dipeptidyl aminopeptidase/acylaminoacyl peptidase